MILIDRRIGLKQITDALNISYERVLHIVYVNLSIWNTKYLNVEQKRESRLISTLFKNNENFLIVL